MQCGMVCQLAVRVRTARPEAPPYRSETAYVGPEPWSSSRTPECPAAALQREPTSHRAKLLAAQDVGQARSSITFSVAVSSAVSRSPAPEEDALRRRRESKDSPPIACLPALYGGC